LSSRFAPEVNARTSEASSKTTLSSLAISSFAGAVVNAHPARAFNTDLVPHQRRFAERRHGSRSFARKHVSERGAAETAPARAAVRRQDARGHSGVACYVLNPES
jgi:hypothetical protein